MPDSRRRQRQKDLWSWLYAEVILGVLLNAFEMTADIIVLKQSVFTALKGYRLNPQAKEFVPTSEFPSLSAGAPQTLSQAHHPNAGQTAWANQRASQPTPVQRPQQAPGIPSQQNNQAQEAVQQTLDDAFFPTSQYGSNQQGSDHLPTFSFLCNINNRFLGRSTHGEIGQDRRGSLAPASGFGGFPSHPSSAFGQQQNYMQTRASELGDAPGLERRPFPGRDGGFGKFLATCIPR